MDTTWWKWIVLLGVLAIGLLRGMVLVRRAARSRSELNKEELTVMRQAAAGVGREPFARGTLGWGLLLWLPPGWAAEVQRDFSYVKDRAAAKKLVPANSREQNRAQGVIFSFHELRLTRTELIRGYQKDAQRIPLQGLTATVTTGQTVQIRIEGPDTKFVYRNAFDAEFNVKPALQFAALLNYEASLQGAPPKKVQEKPPTTSPTPQTDARDNPRR